MNRFGLHSEAGQTNIEYQLILVIFSIALIGLLTFMAGTVQDFYSGVQELIQGAMTNSSP